MKKLNIAIDGPAGSGKSTIAKKLSSEYGIIYVDTGAMYRAVAYMCVANGKDTKSSEDVLSILNDINIEIKWDENSHSQYVIANGEDVTGKIRTPEISMGASNVAKIPEVRLKLVDIQRTIANSNSVVMDGRDIGTYVLKNANFKIFMTASIDERAKRRYEELKTKGEDVDFNELKKDIEKRDEEDSKRSFAPLKKADDAIELDTTNMNISGVVEYIKNIIEHHKKNN